MENYYKKRRNQLIKDILWLMLLLGGFIGFCVGMIYMFK